MVSACKRLMVPQRPDSVTLSKYVKNSFYVKLSAQHNKAALFAALFLFDNLIISAAKELCKLGLGIWLTMNQMNRLRLSRDSFDKTQ